MIKKLRAKFILINMIFVVSILAAVLITLFMTNAKKQSWNARILLEQMMERPVLPRVERDRNEERRKKNIPPPLPFLVILAGEDGNILEISENSISVEKETAEELVRIVLTTEDSEGVLKDYSLRFIKKETPSGIKIVFLDQSYEISTLRNLARNCLLIFFIGCLLFLALSFFLSRWALKPVELAWSQQNQFIADASHELKTPLTVILANLQILSSHRESTIAEQSRWLDNTKEEAARMKQLVEDLLFLARSDAGGHSAPSAPFPLSDAVITCVLLFESVAFEQKVELKSEIVPGLEYFGNESRLKEAVTILLDNACKYAGKSGTVSVSLKKNQGHYLLKVNNTGEPISPEDQSRLFERFYRADKSRSREDGGYGLGLAIAKTIVEAHKGKISVSSSPENGTTFAISLPALNLQAQGRRPQ